MAEPFLQALSCAGWRGLVVLVVLMTAGRLTPGVGVLLARGSDRTKIESSDPCAMEPVLPKANANNNPDLRNIDTLLTPC